MTRKEILSAYAEKKSIKAAAKNLGISEYKVRRTLIDAGVLVTQRASYILDRVAARKSITEIAEEMQLTPDAVASNLPYRRKPYGMSDRSPNALRIAAWREKRRHKNDLHLDPEICTCHASKDVMIGTNQK
jgi:DNA-binding CsgD family transcriptional regulator